MMIPLSYELKRIVAQHRHRLWCAAALAGLPAAPVYLFPDQEKLDSDEVETVARRIAAEPLRLPHDEVIFELTDRSSWSRSQVAFVRRTDEGIDAYLILRARSARQWTDVLNHARFGWDGIADVETNPATQSSAEADAYAVVLTGLVWRALALLSQAAIISELPFPRTRQPKLARAGVSGWTWRLVDIDTGRLRAAVQEGSGTHASPRWHIRRGHWRTLPNGHRTFVRACEVGDPSRGGVVKDYRVATEIAA